MLTPTPLMAFHPRMAIRKVGTARIIREIGRGGMGVVYEAEQEELGRKVAVKELPPEVACNKDSSERFRREGMAYAQLHHQAIPMVFDLCEKNDALYLITEYVDGPDLSRIMQKGGPLPPDCVAYVGWQVADALHHVHANGLVHRDIKPSNIMITSTGDVKLMDFGIVKDESVTDLTREGMVVGSPPYMAPEVLMGGRADAKSDLWALGITLYELLAGDRPFKGRDTTELFTSIGRGKYESLRKAAPAVPRILGSAIERCLITRADKRFRDAGEMARALSIQVRWLAPDIDPRNRLVALLVDRGFLQVDQVTVMDAATLHATRSIEVSQLWRTPVRRWPWVVAALTGVAAGAAAGANTLGLLRWPWPLR